MEQALVDSIADAHQNAFAQGRARALDKRAWEIVHRVVVAARRYERDNKDSEFAWEYGQIRRDAELALEAANRLDYEKAMRKLNEASNRLFLKDVPDKQNLNSMINEAKRTIYDHTSGTQRDVIDSTGKMEPGPDVGAMAGRYKEPNIPGGIVPREQVLKDAEYFLGEFNQLHDIASNTNRDVGKVWYRNFLDGRIADLEGSKEQYGFSEPFAMPKIAAKSRAMALLTMALEDLTKAGGNIYDLEQGLRFGTLQKNPELFVRHADGIIESATQIKNILEGKLK